MIGNKLAHYEITAHLGSGGMGDVYQATDLKLGRSVAIKLLPVAFASDADRLSRFRREAQVLGSLNHPNIAHIYGLEEFGEVRCIVMELVEGETLQARIRRGAVPVNEALPIANQIAEALEAAHAKGVVHRDLKPGNVMLTGDGKVKVLDFGLAKAYEASPSDANWSNSPTMATMTATNAGMILGTAGYMSPEQAKGRSVDHRTDIFAFGCVLYEMLTGRSAFDGEDVTDILSSILHGEPDWTLLPAQVPHRIQELLRLCLEKNLTKRRQAAGDVRIDIEQVLAAPQTQQASAPAHGTRGWLVAVVAVLAAVGLAIPAMRYMRETPPPEMRLEINTPSTTDLLSMAISPDAQRIVFVAAADGQPRLWVRSLDSVSARVLAGTDGARYPFWSPDSRSVAFFADGQLKRIDAAGGAVQTLSTAQPLGGTWNREGVILFTSFLNGPILRVSAAGGQPSAVTRLQRPTQSSHRFPKFLPDGRHFLYYVYGDRGVYVGSLDNPEDTQRLCDADAAAEYDSSGYLLLPRQGALFAQKFDPSRLKLSGDAFPVSDQVAFHPTALTAAVSASAAGPVAFRTGGGSTQQLVWFDRSGKEIGTVGAPDAASPGNIALSPDGRRVAIDRAVNGTTDIWLGEIARGGLLNRFTVGPANNTSPIWSPNGDQIVFASNQMAFYNLYRKTVSGAATDELILESRINKVPEDFSPDGRFLLYESVGAQTGYDIWALPLTGEGKSFSVVQTRFEERDGQFSPDGKWIAYRSNESGRFEIYVQAFPGPGGQALVSTNGGAQPRWRSDGKEIFYIGLDSRLMAVPISVAANGQTLEPGQPTALFTTRIAFGPLPGARRQQYAVSSDGQRFLVTTLPQDAAPPPITLILNWHPEQYR
jgi:Tol biopolymer transport system component